MLTLLAAIFPLSLLLPPPPHAPPPHAPPPVALPVPVVELLLEGLTTSPHPRRDAVDPRSATWPLDPEPVVVTGFDPPSAVWSAGHRGVDLLGTPGQSVLAAMAGRVSFAGTIAGRGVVVVSHGSRRTTYEPVQASVRTGDQVPLGGVIGTLQTGRSHCAPRACLHWGLLEGQVYLDPLSLLGSVQVRLLPMS